MHCRPLWQVKRMNVRRHGEKGVWNKWGPPRSLPGGCNYSHVINRQLETSFRRRPRRRGPFCASFYRLYTQVTQTTPRSPQYIYVQLVGSGLQCRRNRFWSKIWYTNPARENAIFSCLAWHIVSTGVGGWIVALACQPNSVSGISLASAKCGSICDFPFGRNRQAFFEEGEMARPHRFFTFIEAPLSPYAQHRTGIASFRRSDLNLVSNNLWIKIFEGSFSHFPSKSLSSFSTILPIFAPFFGAPLQCPRSKFFLDFT